MPNGDTRDIYTIFTIPTFAVLRSIPGDSVGFWVGIVWLAPEEFVVGAGVVPEDRRCLRCPYEGGMVMTFGVGLAVGSTVDGW